MGGIGKSTLAAALAHDPEVQSHFPDGIFWATLGQQPDILSFLSTWIQQLGDYDFKPINIDSASLQLRTLLSDKKALLVVDDVWHPDHVDPFRVAGGGCRVLVTTREAPVNGAIRYNLDVMTPKQSLELLTSCLQIFSDESTSLPLAASPLNPPASNPSLGDFDSISPQRGIPRWGARGAKIAVNNQLTNQELDYAETLAKTVGYLPLGLELAAAQVRDGFSWEELLGALQAEIADLEALDRLEAEEEPSDAKRKNYSLVASFNLSLKRLSPERLKQFAWLGVLPEDVTITETMATTLWDSNLVKAKKTLRYLRQKALLLPGVSSTQKTNYRLHDLLHDLARNLLTSSTTPEQVSQLPGLGLSIPEAHQQLLERYQTKTEKGLWHTLPDDGYIYNHLTWHLEKAQKIDEIHQLLKEETAEGDNGWYWQCDRKGKTANFVKDVSRAWGIAAAKFTENPTESISLQCRYALITTSLNSLAGNIPPELMAALVEKEIWTAAQALAYVRQSKDCQGQAEGLKAIIEYLPASLLPEALDCARGIHPQWLWQLLNGLAPHLPQGLLHQALDCAKAIGDEWLRFQALVSLAPHLPQRLLPQALDFARAIGDESHRADALISLAPHFPEVLPEALDCARAIGDESKRVKALLGLAPHLPDVLPEALDCARAIGDESHRADFFISLAPHFPEVLPEALDCARTIEDAFQRSSRLEDLARYFPDVLPEALDAIRGIRHETYRISALFNLAPQLPQGLLDQALDCARAIGDEYYRVQVLVCLSAHLPEVLPEALETARAIGDKFQLVQALVCLSAHLPEVLPEALDCARAIGDKFQLVYGLLGLTPHLPDVLPEALDCARAIGDESKRVQALVWLSPHFPEVLPEALDCARAIGDESKRVYALKSLVPHLPQSFLPQVLDALRALRNEYERVYVLKDLGPHFPEVLPQVLDVPRAIANEYSRVYALRDHYSGVYFLKNLFPHFLEVLPEALDVPKPIGDEYSRVYTLLGLVSDFPEVLPEALDCARAIGHEFYRVYALKDLAPYFPEVLPEALDAARAIGDEYYRVYALLSLVPHLPEVLPEAFDCARAIGDESKRVYALVSLASHLPEVLPEALDAARAIENESNRAEVLLGLAPHFPEVLPEALDCAIAICSEFGKTDALLSLAPHLPQSLLPQALDAARAIGDDTGVIGNGLYRSSALMGLVPQLPQNLLPEALEVAKTIENKDDRAKVLKMLMEKLTPSSVDFPLWQQILDCLASLTRPDFLEALPQLAPLIIKFGGIEALRKTVAAVDDVSRWWK